MAPTKGIDISQYQGKPDFAKVKSSVDYVIAKAGYGKYASQKDPSFEHNYSQCKRHGIPMGAYWYSYANSVADAQAEAQACLTILKGKKFEYPIYYDVEEGSQFAKGTQFINSIIKAFCSVLEQNGYYVGVYMSRGYVSQYLSKDTLGKYALWIAEYGASKPNYSGMYGMWQYSSTGKIPGITGHVDLDFGYFDYPSAIKSAGLNGYEKPKNTKKTLDSTGMKEGSRGLDVLAYKQLLIAAKQAGIISQKVDNNEIFGEGTKKATNEVLASGDYVQNGIAGTETIKYLGKIIKGSV